MKRVVGVLVALALLLIAGAAPAQAGMDDVETPTVEGPVAVAAGSTPWAATDKPLASYGYVEEEYFYEGDAYRYDTTGDVDQTGTRIETGGPADDGTYPYVTRMIVRRPANPADFNGTAIVEWQNVTAQFDLEANWFGDPEYLLENGYAYVAISAQRVGVNHLRGWNGSRYGDLDVSWRDNDGKERFCPSPASDTCDPQFAGDALSYDIYAAGVKALLGGGIGDDPLGNLPVPETVIASGESQSGGRLNTYYNKVQPIHELVNAFLLTVSYGQLRDDRDEPVIRVLSETENRVPRTLPDTDSYRQWEVAGGSHLPRMAFENFLGPISRDLGAGVPLAASCERYPLSRVQWPLVVNAAYEHLVRWANGGAAPPIAPRGTYQDEPADPADQLVRDELGIAQGGIRLPEVSVPARVNTGINTFKAPLSGLFSAFCGLLGSTEDLPDPVLLSRYDDWSDYMAEVRAKAQALVTQGFLLEQDRPRLVEMHEQVPNLRPTGPQRTTGQPQNKGNFKLEWLGTTNPLGTFELQHSKDGGTTWSGVPGAGALTQPSFEFAPKRESDGRWIYRVRSNTTIPADAVRDEFVITTPFSEPSARTLVDRTGPKLRLKCPKKVKVGKRAFAKIKASDKGVGLKKDPSGKKRINTRRKGTQKIKAKAVDKLGNKTVKTCKVKVKKAKKKRG